ncbi:MAG: hypothetical protein QOF98_3828 [Streptomyces sp.]|nr:hypothetical protein [Streptomyces sp.]
MPRVRPAVRPRPQQPARQSRPTEPTQRAQPVFVEPKGCLYALSQPPLMLFLSVIGGLIGAGACWDLLFL